MGEFSRRIARERMHAGIISFCLALVLFISFVPVLLMMFMSVRSRGQILTNFWALPNPVLWTNYIRGWQGIRPFIVNSVLYCTAAIIPIILFTSLTGFAMGTMRIPGKETLFYAILALMMIPGILTLFPRMSLIYRYNLVNTAWALVLPWAAGGQVMGVFLMRTSFEGIHIEIREAAYVDGATPLQQFAQVCLPLVWPMAVTLAIMNFVGLYNDLVWPLIVMQDRSKQVVAVGLLDFTAYVGTSDLGPQMAGYVISSLPLLIVFLFGMRYYIAGISSGAVKM
jgi:ABC-type glycerol-3-phosphate transport system permease component